MRKNRWSRLPLLILVALFPFHTTVAAATPGTATWFRETSHTLGFAFRDFYESHGGLSMFGYPLTEVFREDGRPVQYFERARLEWHADLGLVLAGHLGRWAAEQQAGQPAFRPVAAPDPTPSDADFFGETAHTLRGAFRSYWRQNGALPVFGFPLSEELVEHNAEDGHDYTVQYFERARFELHPDLPPPYRVSLGHIGRRYLAAHGAPDWALAPASDANAAWAAFRPTRITIARIGIDTQVTEAGFSLGTWDVPRYTAAHYWPVGAFPGTAGNIIVAGHVGYRDTIFSHLPQVQAGDEIQVFVGETPHRYVVREVLTLLPSDTWVMLPTSGEILTLITCVPIGVYSHRLIVRAEPTP